MAELTTTAKKRWAVLLLALLAVWPAIHYGLYRRYGIEPWKLFGWAMYARPRSAPQLAVFALRGEELSPLELQSEDAIAEAKRLGRMRGALGELQSMDSLGALLLAEEVSLDGVRIVVRRVAFDCSTALIDDVRSYTYEYRRPQSEKPTTAVAK